MIKITLHCGQYTVTGDYLPGHGFKTAVSWAKSDYDFDRMLVPEMTGELLIHELRKLSLYFDLNCDTKSSFSYERRLTGYEKAA